MLHACFQRAACLRRRTRLLREDAPNSRTTAARLAHSLPAGRAGGGGEEAEPRTAAGAAHGFWTFWTPQPDLPSMFPHKLFCRCGKSVP